MSLVIWEAGAGSGRVGGWVDWLLDGGGEVVLMGWRGCWLSILAQEEEESGVAHYLAVKDCTKTLSTSQLLWANSRWGFSSLMNNNRKWD